MTTGPDWVVAGAVGPTARRRLGGRRGVERDLPVTDSQRTLRRVPGARRKPHQAQGKEEPRKSSASRRARPGEEMPADIQSDKMLQKFASRGFLSARHLADIRKVACIARDTGILSLIHI